MPIDEGARKKIIISVAILVLAVGYTVFRHMRGGGNDIKALLPERVLKCRQCSHVVSPSSEELKSMVTERDNVYLEQLAQSNPDQAEYLKKVMANREGGRTTNPNDMAIIPNWGGMNWPFTCPNCNQDALYFASKCPKCGEIYFDFDEQGNYSDKCPNPKCGYSASEEIKRRSQEKKAAEQAKKTALRQKQKDKEKELD
jgi:DNA-directed RNA polymerase subunit M/transcription elongation factor TFIIS